MSESSIYAKHILYITVQLSLIVQILTGMVDVYALTWNYKGDMRMIKGLIGVETFVQFIEIVFYLWLYLQFDSAVRITEKRYYDWVITTPSMLFILIVYLEFLRYDNSVPEINDESVTTFEYLFFALQKHGGNLSIIVFLNFLMLVFGYLAEKKIIGKYFAMISGFIPFILYFYYIYINYAVYSEKGKILFTIFAGIWSLYGVSLLLPYTWKNVSYNILDIFSKNFFGIFLVYIALINMHN